MTYQEVLLQGKVVLVTGMVSRSGKCHKYVKKYVGRQGCVIGEAKNGMLLVAFGNRSRAIPAGCVTRDDEVTWAK